MSNYERYERGGAVVMIDGAKIRYQIVLFMKDGTYAVEDALRDVANAAKACVQPPTGSLACDLLDMSMHRLLFDKDKP